MITDGRITRTRYSNAEKKDICSKINLLIDAGISTADAARIVDVNQDTISTWRRSGLVHDGKYTEQRRRIYQESIAKRAEAMNKPEQTDIEIPVTIEVPIQEKVISNPKHPYLSIIENLVKISRMIDEIAMFVEEAGKQ